MAASLTKPAYGRSKRGTWLRVLASTQASSASSRGFGLPKDSTQSSQAKVTRMTPGQRKAQVIDVTVRLLDEFGVQGATTPRIAAAAGVSEPILHKHFANRRDMLSAALDVAFDQAEAVVRSSQEPNILERLRKIGEYHTKTTYAKRLGFVSPVFESVIAPPEAGLRDRVRSRSLVIVEALSSAIEEGIAQNTIGRTSIRSSSRGKSLVSTGSRMSPLSCIRTKRSRRAPLSNFSSGFWLTSQPSLLPSRAWQAVGC
jgi:AcrR family transcriptional regulator